MSVQFGRWNFDGRPLDRNFFAEVSQMTAKYGPDGESASFQSAVGMLYRPFSTTKESLHETQPLRSSAGVLLTWDGRLDNRDELIPLLHLSAGVLHTDAAIVLAAYQQWDTACLGRFIGDWALAIWDPIKQVLLLAKDFVGTRHLFYTLQPGRITWSTVIDPLVLLAGRPFGICEEFIAGYLSRNPETHLTPFVGVKAVPAGTFVRTERGLTSQHEYWRFDPSHPIRYRTDAEYEDHFRHVFAAAVRRRLRSHAPVLAELSGGMDSSAIVCMADAAIAEGQAETPRLDTISYYDDNEPNWDERTFFSLVEEKRGREGYHIDVGRCAGVLELPEDACFFPFPGCDQLAWNRALELRNCLQASGSRVLLSGIGGDEFLGGVPTPAPELLTLFARLRWLRFAQQLSKWSLQQRRPWTHLLFETAEAFFPQTILRLYRRADKAPWLSRHFVESNARAFWLDTRRIRLTGPLPNVQCSLNTLDHLRRQLGVAHFHEISNCTVSYPYFDRDLLAFLFAIPREQLVRPHQRRSLMRRALAGIVPSKILARKRKGYVARRPLVLIGAAMPRIDALLRSPAVVAYGWADPAILASKVESARHGDSQHMTALVGILKLELWLQTIVQKQHLAFADPRSGLFSSVQSPSLQRVRIGLAAADRIEAARGDLARERSD
jgi:asparagine synthase (glutamine-hydrolysing)